MHKHIDGLVYISSKNLQTTRKFIVKRSQDRATDKHFKRQRPLTPAKVSEAIAYFRKLLSCLRAYLSNHEN